jgi:Uma2 family endonuclease
MSTIAAIKPSSLVTAPKYYTLREYLAKEERSQYKHEFHNGQIIRMPGSKIKHNEISGNVIAALKNAVKRLNTKYRVITSDQKIYIPETNKSLYADALVICKEPELWEDREDLLLNPLVIVEVASNSTRQYDRGEKFMSYRLIPSFREYILIEQDKSSVETWFRIKPNTWEVTSEQNIEGAIELRSIGVSIALEDIYENIVFLKK